MASTNNALTPDEHDLIRRLYTLKGSGYLARRLKRSRATIWCAARDLGLTGERPPEGFMSLMEAACDLECSDRALHARVAALPSTERARVYKARNGRAYLRRSYVESLQPHYDRRSFARGTDEVGYLTVQRAARELDVPVNTVRRGIAGVGAFAALKDIRRVYAPYGPQGMQHAHLLNPHDVADLARRRRAELATLRRTHEPAQDLLRDLAHVHPRLVGITLAALMREHGNDRRYAYVGARRHAFIPKHVAALVRAAHPKEEA